jgi:hypothetical protein
LSASYGTMDLRRCTMALLFKEDQEHLEAEAGTQCWFCARPIGDEVPVCWAAESVLVMHGECALRLGTHLIRDSRTKALRRLAARVAGQAFHRSEHEPMALATIS